MANEQVKASPCAGSYLGMLRDVCIYICMFFSFVFVRETLGR